MKHDSRTVRPRGVTIIEVSLLCALLVLVIAVAMPALAAIGCADARLVSRQNLATLAQAHAAYAGTWSNRQFTMVPDDFGAFGGSCASYLQSGNCIEGVSFGATCDGVEVGALIGCSPSNCGNISLVKPIEFDGANQAEGAYAYPNAKGFQPFVDGRFYSPTFYAPDDVGIYERAVSPLEAMESDVRAKATAPASFNQKGVWHRGTPFRANGVFGQLSADFLVNTSYHWLTVDGIEGRDVLD
ncbi:MAG: hypothetical protein SGJ11_07260 [Phycisphaerae bacterium]|nr:hypothetical protein [Phycisphaerae bacterium]